MPNCIAALQKNLNNGAQLINYTLRWIEHDEQSSMPTRKAITRNYRAELIEENNERALEKKNRMCCGEMTEKVFLFFFKKCPESRSTRVDHCTSTLVAIRNTDRVPCTVRTKTYQRQLPSAGTASHG